MGNRNTRQKKEIVGYASSKETPTKKIRLEETKQESTTINSNRIIEEPKETIDKESNKETKEIKETKEEEKTNEDTPNFISGFQRNFFGDDLRFDFLRKNNFVFFSQESARDTFDKMLKKIKKYFPKNYEDLSESLDNYMRNRQTEIYRENRSFLKTISLRLNFLFIEESFNEEVRTRAKRIAFILSQINADIEEKKRNRPYAVIVNSSSLKVEPLEDQLFAQINNDIEKIKIQTDTSEDMVKSLNVLDNILMKFNQKIKEKSDENKEKILKAFLANKINTKLQEIGCALSSEEKSFHKQFLLLTSKLNKIIIDNLDYSELHEKPFLEGLEGVCYTYIVDTKKIEKIIVSGLNIGKFKKELNKKVKNLYGHLKKFETDDTDETNIDNEKPEIFYKNNMNSIKKSEKKLLENKLEMNKINGSILEETIDTLSNIPENFINTEGKKDFKKNKENKENVENEENKEEDKEGYKKKFKAVIQTSKQVNNNLNKINALNTEKNYLKNEGNLLDYIIKRKQQLSNIYELNELIKQETKKKNIKSLLITKFINIPGNSTSESYELEVIENIKE